MIHFTMVLFGIFAILIFFRAIYNDDGLTMGLLLFTLLIGFWFAVEADWYGYERGQIDALNGEYKYEMKVKQDTSYVEVSD